MCALVGGIENCEQKNMLKVAKLVFGDEMNRSLGEVSSNFEVDLRTAKSSLELFFLNF